jgi:Tol biopolymer transport system component
MYMADAHSDYLRQLGVARADGTGAVFFGNLFVGWSQDSRSLIFLDMPGIGEGHSFDYNVWRYTLATGAKTRVAAAGGVHNFGTVAAARGPAGAYFVYNDWEAEDVETADGWELVRLPKDLWRMSADGASIVRLTSGAGHNADPSVGPSGAVAFASDRGGSGGGGGPGASGTPGARDASWDVWLMSSAEPAAQAVNLTNRAGYDGQPAISPSGNLIAYVSDATGTREIWIIAADGSGVPRLISGLEGSVGK